MTLPVRYQQLFTYPVSLSYKDEARLSPFLTSWRQLSRIIAGTNEPDLRRLIVLELMGAARWAILERLLSRLGSIERARLIRKVRRLCRK